MPQSPSWDRVGAVEPKPLAKKTRSTPKSPPAARESLSLPWNRVKDQAKPQYESMFIVLQEIL